MTPYLDIDGDSGVRGFDLGAGSIDVYFKDGAIYRYTNMSAGSANIAAMTRLARSGDGLNSFINRHVKKGYSARIR